MQWNYVVVIFVICFIFACTVKVLVNNNLNQMVHTIEFIAAFSAIVFCLRNIYPYFVLSVLIFFMYRTVLRIAGDCIDAVRSNKDKNE